MNITIPCAAVKLIHSQKFIPSVLQKDFLTRHLEIVTAQLIVIAQ